MQKGDKIGPYFVIDEIGRGGMAAVVYLVEDTKKEKWAIKLLLSVATQKDVDLIKRAAKIYRKLHHRSIVHVNGYTYLPPYHCLIMEYAEGKNLQNILDKGKKLSIPDIIQISWEICDALEYAHSKKVIHRDLKPHNIIVNKNNCLKVTDFDLASIASRSITSLSGMVGTPQYISPEQAANEEGDERSDLYSVGIIIYQMLTGRVPFEAANYSVLLDMHKNAKPTPILDSRPDDTPKRLIWLVEKAMEKSPSDRFQSASEMRQALEEIAAEENTPLVDRKPLEPFWKRALIWPFEHSGSIVENILANIIWIVLASSFVMISSWWGIRNWEDIAAWLNSTPTPVVLADTPTPTPTNSLVPSTITPSPMSTKTPQPPTVTATTIPTEITPTNTPIITSPTPVELATATPTETSSQATEVDPISIDAPVTVPNESNINCPDWFATPEPGKAVLMLENHYYREVDVWYLAHMGSEVKPGISKERRQS